MGEDIYRAAKWYGRFGWAVFPVHNATPTGCTCETFERTRRPNFVCSHQGKCPRVKWRDRSTTDPDQLYRWFGHPWNDGYVPNIGVDCGKSGILVLDLDSYKETFDDDLDLLPLAERKTVTQISGGGGEHLFYAMPPDVHLGNAKGKLPAGFDVRGDGGYIIVAPSLHFSGRRYQYEAGYGPHEIALQPVPEFLIEMLTEAQNVTHPVSLANHTERPNLERWHLSQRIRQFIENPPPAGKRSEADAAVAAALIACGATDAEVQAVFEHYPIGQAGKMADKGAQARAYLSLTIAHARGFVTQKTAEERNNRALRLLAAGA